jgi:hypothetical protein
LLLLGGVSRLRGGSKNKLADALGSFIFYMSKRRSICLTLLLLRRNTAFHIGATFYRMSLH